MKKIVIHVTHAFHASLKARAKAERRKIGDQLVVEATQGQSKCQQKP